MGLAKQKHDWTFVTPAPPREVFASMEQMIGTRPYRFEVIDPGQAQIVEFQRRGFFGTWSTPRVGLRWVRVDAVRTDQGSRVTVRCSAGGGLVAKAVGKSDHGPLARALQMVKLFTQGRGDSRTIYRERPIPPGPVTLVASWAGMGYRLFSEPRFDADRGAEILTATEIEALAGGNEAFVKVRLSTGDEGYVERDQVVAAPATATREAQTAVARASS
jgi:hypothetical protein